MSASLRNTCLPQAPQDFIALAQAISVHRKLWPKPVSGGVTCEGRVSVFSPRAGEASLFWAPQLCAPPAARVKPPSSGGFVRRQMGGALGQQDFFSRHEQA